MPRCSACAPVDDARLVDRARRAADLLRHRRERRRRARRLALDRVCLTLQCDEAAGFEVILPGGASASFDTDATGAFTGVAGDAYVCSGHPQPVAVLASGASGDWSGLLTIGTEAGAPADPDGPGPVCDLMLHPGFNYVTYDGPLAEPSTVLANDHFTAVLPFGASSSSNGADDVMAVFESIPGAVPAERRWVQWRPSAPAAVNELHALRAGPQLRHPHRRRARLDLHRRDALGGRPSSRGAMGPQRRTPQRGTT